MIDELCPADESDGDNKRVPCGDGYTCAGSREECALLVTLRRAKLAKMSSMHEDDLKKRVQTLVRNDMYTNTHTHVESFQSVTTKLYDAKLIDRESILDGCRYNSTATGRPMAAVCAAWQEALDTARSRAALQPPAWSWRPQQPWDPINQRWDAEAPHAWHARHRIVLLVDEREPREHHRGKTRKLCS